MDNTAPELPPDKPALPVGSVHRSQRILVAAQVVRLLLFVMVTVLLGRWLAPADFGFVALVSTLFLAAQELLDMGTTAVTTRQVAQDPAHERPTLHALLAWRRLLAGCMALGLLLLAAFGSISQADQRWVLSAAALAMLTLPLSAYHVVFQTRQAFGRASLLAMGTQLAFLLASVAVIQAQAAGMLPQLSTGAALGLLVVAREMAQVLGSRWLASKLLGYRLRTAWFDPGLTALLRRAWVFGVAGVSYKLSSLMGSFFLWTWHPAQELGTYSAAHRLFGPLSDTAWMFATPLIASLAITAREQPQAVPLQLDALIKWLIALSCCVAVGGQFVGPWVLQLLYGGQYIQGDTSAVGVFQGLSLGLLFTLVTPVLAVSCLAQGRDRVLMTVSVVGLLVNLLGNIFWVPGRGMSGAAMAWCVGEGWVMLSLLVFAMRRREVRWSMRDGVYGLPAAALLLALPTLQAHPTAQFVIGGAVTVLGMALLRQLPSQRAARLSMAAIPNPGISSSTAGVTP